METFRRVLIWAIIAPSPFATVHAQENFGMATGNYAGVSGAWFNPASIVDSRYKFDMSVYTFDSYFTNNFLNVRNATLVRRLLQKDPYNGSYDAVKDDLLRPIKDMNEPVHASASTQWQLPSFMFNAGKRSAIALNFRSRSAMTLENMDPNTARSIYGELQDPDFFGQVQDNSGLNYNFLNWTELGFTYGRVLASGKHHFLKVAATGKVLSGNAAIHISSEDLKFTVEDQSVISLQSPLIQYARTNGADFDTYRRRNLFEGQDLTMGGDVGFVYELRGKVSKRTFTDFDQEEKERKDLNKYIVRVGVALLDIGQFTFNRMPLTQDHSADINAWDVSELDASDLDDFDQGYSQKVTYVQDGAPTFTYRLPTAISANIDLHAFNGFYVNVAAYRDATGLFADSYATMKAREWTAVTPRYENRWFGAYVPISRSEGTTRIGATLRFGPFYFGSNNLVDILGADAGPTADFHAGVRLSIGQGKPSVLKKRYQAMRQVSEGVGSNRLRLDSLEREVYALKMVVTTDSLRGPSVVNNYYGGSTVTDTNAVRLQQESDYLKQELAASYVRMEQDSIALAELEELVSGSGGNTEPSKVVWSDKKATKAAENQANATEDIAKQIEKIDKRMKRQNAILATGAATGIIAAASSGDKKKDAPESAMLVNDSTVLIGTDTVRLVAPVGSTLRPADVVPVPASTSDTMRVVVYDTVRVVVSDTTRLTVNDTARVVLSTPAPGTISADEAERKRLMEPVYFATGRTALGPQGKVKVSEIAAWLKKNQAMNVVVTGVADASGSSSVNGTVARKRADSVRQELIAKGIEAERITTEHKLSPAGSAPDAKDRRAEVRFVE